MRSDAENIMSPKLLKAKIKDPATGEMLEGFPICAVTKEGLNSYWMVRADCTVEGLTTGGMVHLGERDLEKPQPNFLKAKAMAFADGKVVEGFPFFAKGDTEESSYWLIRSGCTVEELLTDGLVNIVPESITYLDL